MRFNGYKQRLEKARLDPDIQRVCLMFVERLARLNDGDGYHLGLPFFANQLSDESQNLVLPALSILCTMNSPILSMHGYLDAEDGQHHLDDSDFRSLLSGEDLAHPETGETVPDPMHHVRIFYAIRDEVRDEP